MAYLYIILAAVGIAATFILQKLYQNKFCINTKDFAFLPILLGIFNILFYFTVSGFKLDFSIFSLILAFIYALTTTYNTITGLVIMKYCSMSLFSLFIMMGGMIVPFFYGILFSPQQEIVTIGKMIGLILMILALILVFLNKVSDKTSKKGLLLCVSVFISNGLVSTTSKVHQIYGELGIYEALSSSNFMIYVTAFSIIMSLIVYIVISKKSKTNSDERIDNDIQSSVVAKSRFGWQIILTLLIVAFSCSSSLFSLTAQKTVDASIIFPIVSGGTIVLMTLLGRVFYKETINKTTAIGVAIAIIASFLFIL